MNTLCKLSLAQYIDVVGYVSINNYINFTSSTVNVTTTFQNQFLLSLKIG
jgi:hypothetical protein